MERIWPSVDHFVEFIFTINSFNSFQDGFRVIKSDLPLSNLVVERFWGSTENKREYDRWVAEGKDKIVAPKKDWQDNDW